MYKFIKLTILVSSDIDYENEVFFKDEDGLIKDYLMTLNKNGQIMSDYSLLKDNDKYIVYCNVAEVDAINEKYNNEYVNRSYKYLTIKLDVLGDNISYYDDCDCGKTSWYLLYADYTSFDSDSPLFCGECGKAISLHKIPKLFGEKEHWKLLIYQETYTAVDTLWMNSLSDRFTKRQITDVNSQLVKSGLEVRKELEDKLSKPIYLYIRKPMGGWFGPDTNEKTFDKCPICGESLQPSLNNDICGKMCHKCRVSYNVYDD